MNSEIRRNENAEIVNVLQRKFAVVIRLAQIDIGRTVVV